MLTDVEGAVADIEEAEVLVGAVSVDLKQALEEARFIEDLEEAKPIEALEEAKPIRDLKEAKPIEALEATGRRKVPTERQSKPLGGLM